MAKNASRVRVYASSEGDFAEDLAFALSERPRRLSPKYLYDARGSQLFDRICDLPEYYPTRAEIQILQARAPEIAELIGPRAEIIEFGAGSLLKVRLLFDALNAPQRYLPVDICGQHLEASAAALRTAYPQLPVQPVVADYTLGLSLPPVLEGTRRRVGFFPGSTLGNLDSAEALQFLQSASRQLRGGGLLIGVDLVKSPARLHAAYNDAQGVTAEFNKNLLMRANAELQTDFNISAFEHYAFYNAPLRRVEMHLVSLRKQSVGLNGELYEFEEGETIHTESSHKFSIDGMRGLAARAGFGVGTCWTDLEGLFSVYWLPAPP